jgi:hypothetical protein
MKRTLVAVAAAVAVTFAATTGANADTGEALFRVSPPCRAADTRYPAGSLKGGGWRIDTTDQSRQTVIIDLGTQCFLPSNAVAAAINVAIVHDGGTKGYVSVVPANRPRGGVSLLNPQFRADVLNNAVIMPVDSQGRIKVYYSSDRWGRGTDVFVDITGSFVR